MMSRKNAFLVVSLLVSAAALQATTDNNNAKETRRAKAAKAVKNFFKEKFGKKESAESDKNTAKKENKDK